MEKEETTSGACCQQHFFAISSQIGRMIPKLFQLGENNSKNERVTFFLRFKHKIQNYEPRGQAATLF